MCSILIGWLHFSTSANDEIYLKKKSPGIRFPMRTILSDMRLKAMIGRKGRRPCPDSIPSELGQESVHPRSSLRARTG